MTSTRALNLDVLTSEDFRYGPLNNRNTDAIIAEVAQVKEVEIARRDLDPSEFKRVIDFAEGIVKKHLKDGVHFDYDITIAALAIIFAEYDDKAPETFLTELSTFYEKKEGNELFWSKRVAHRLVKFKEKLAKVKAKVRHHFPNAIFLPYDELGFIYMPPARMQDIEIETQLIIAVSVGDKVLSIIDHEGQVFELPEEAITVSAPDVAFDLPYLTDYGQTLGFGPYGEHEVEADFVFAQAKTTA